MTILYTPLDIKFEMPDQQALLDWFFANQIDEPDYWVFKEGRHEWALAAASQPVDDWTKIKPYEDWLAQKFTESKGAELRFAPGFEQFTGLVEAIKQMPFKEIGAVGLLRQLIYIEPHTDTKDITRPKEPCRYMIFLTDPYENTFFIDDELVKIHPDYRAFAFNNTDAKHGAHAPHGVKILISVVGILDHERHEEMIARSVAKFPEYVISRQ